LPQALPAKALGSPFIELQSVDSTNNYAREQIKQGERSGKDPKDLDGTAFFTSEQFAGKGQRGRIWSSEKGANIAMSIVIDPSPLKVSQQFQLSACVAVSVFQFLEKYSGDGCSIKWPNDLYWQDRKAGGILIESVVRNTANMEEPAWPWAIVGIGININQTVFPEHLPNPVSLKQITGKQFDIVSLAHECCSMIDKNYKQLLAEGFDRIYSIYNHHLYKRSSSVRLKKDNRLFTAVIKEVSASGTLVVQHAVEEEFNFGEIEFIGPA